MHNSEMQMQDLRKINKTLLTDNLQKEITENRKR